MPDNHDMVMWWARYMWLSDGNYRTAMERVAAHFLTMIQFPDLEPDEENAWKEFYTQFLDYRSVLLNCAYDYLAYGNVFISAYLPFRRYLICQDCSLLKPISACHYDLHMNSVEPYLTWKRLAPCEKCGSNKPYLCNDQSDPDLKRVNINLYGPQEIELAKNRFSGRKEIRWKIPESDRKDLTSKATIHIEDTPLEVLEAVAANGRLKFNEDTILHIAEPTISGVETRGWGIPRAISNFRTAWLYQIHNKADQASSLDYTLGLRLISPAPNANLDPMQNLSMAEFVPQMQAMLASHRNNPVGWHTAPFPMNYQFMGGEGANLVTPEKLKFRQQELLNQLGVPLEYHQMNLQANAAPMALRLFEAYWQSIPGFYNKVLGWLTELLSRVYNLDKTAVQMQKTTIVDDMSYKQILLQLMSGNQLSPQTALEPLGIDAHQEVKKVIKHQDYVNRVQMEADEKNMEREELGALKGMVSNPTPSMLAQQQAPPPGAPMGGMPMGGIPGATPTGGQPSTLAAMSEQAMQIAQQLVSLPEYERKTQLRQLREGNKELHSLVKSNLEELRSQARSQGAQMLLQPPPSG
jgi:hypothetical protein